MELPIILAGNWRTGEPCAQSRSLSEQEVTHFCDRLSHLLAARLLPVAGELSRRQRKRRKDEG